MKFKEEKAEIKGIPAEYIRIDEETGELCVGDDCFKVKYNPSENEIAIEIDPNAPCNPRMQQLAKLFLKKFVEGRPKVKLREKRRLEDY